MNVLTPCVSRGFFFVIQVFVQAMIKNTRSLTLMVLSDWVLVTQVVPLALSRVIIESNELTKAK